MFMTYWNELTNVHEGRYFYRHGRGAEGAKGGANGKALFMEPGNWYRFVKRVFKAEERTDKSTFVGWWVKDVANDTWYTHSVVMIPSDEKGFAGNGGFIEALAPKHHPRTFDRRLGYYRLDGEWHASHLRSNHPARFRLIEDGTVVRFETPMENDPGPEKEEAEVAAKQPAEPPLDRPGIEGAKAQVLGDQVVVSWGRPGGASPQLSYRIEVFADRRGRGAPLVAHTETAPHVFAKRLDVDRRPGSVRLTVKGIFDRETSVLLPAARTAPRPAARVPAKTHPGLQYRFYEAPQGTKWQKLPDFAALTPSRLGYVKKLDDTVSQDRRNLYAMQYEGWLRAPETGIYVIELGTCDGSRMTVDGELVADNDGIHGTSVTHYPLALEKGLHGFALSYFKGERKYLPPKVLFAWEGPGFERRPVAESDLACEAAADMPEVRISLTGGIPGGGALDDSAVELRADIDSAGNAIEKVEFFCGSQLLGACSPVTERVVTLPALLPAGESLISARLWYNGKYSVNANAFTVTATNRSEDPWLIRCFDEKTFPIGVRHRDGELRFRGEGYSYVYQKTRGDFTLTARVKDVAMSTKDSGVAGQNWVGLLTKRIHSNPKVTLETAKGPYAGEDYGLFVTAGRGIRGTSDFPDLGGGRVSVVPYGNQDHRWLRIVRRGRRHLSFTSADGETWNKVAERISERFKEDRYAGICFRAVPGKSRTMFHGAFDSITLEEGAPPEERAKPDPEDVRPRPRIAALVQSASDPKTLFARSSEGLLRSTD
ncbi:MAG: PA14 domain-containing protein, partial [Planctomycetota bacterium]